MLGPLLQLPEGMEVLHVAVGNYGLAFDLVLTAPDMAETDTQIGAVPPMLHPLYEVYGGAVRIVDIDYPREQSAAEPVVDPATTGAPR
jgi:hypothetical protein